MDCTSRQLETVLETHFCDLKDTEEQESRLKEAAKIYFEDKAIPKKVKVFNSLSDEKRLQIIYLLKFREMCNCELTAATNSTQPNLTYHIKILENAGVVKKRREGKFTYYSLDMKSENQKILENI